MSLPPKLISGIPGFIVRKAKRKKEAPSEARTHDLDISEFQSQVRLFLLVSRSKPTELWERLF